MKEPIGLMMAKLSSFADGFFIQLPNMTLPLPDVSLG
jgi:hypothetical protein